MAGTGEANLFLGFSQWRLRQAGDALPAFLEALVEGDARVGGSFRRPPAGYVRDAPLP
jgi:hypothetical protein